MPTLVNAGWAWTCAPAAARFEAALHAPEATQRGILARLLVARRDCRFGRRHGFDRMRSLEDFRARVPLATEVSIRTDLDAVMRGEPDVLFPGHPLGLMPTSGTTRGSRMIPCTAALRAEFQAAIAPWVHGMFRRHPGAFRGRAYWSVSPITDGPSHTAGGIPIGFADDASYLHPFWAHLLRRTLAVPGSAARLQDGDVFRRVSLTFLLAARDLAFVSVWNPTFFMRVLDALDEHPQCIVDDLRRARLTLPQPVPPQVARALQRAFHVRPARAREVAALLTAPDRWSRLWPRLRLLSCWADASAQGPALGLAARFPAAVTEPKGLLATEGVVSIPVGDDRGCALALTSHLLEFLPEAADGEALGAWQLDPGARYRVVITTGGGLYRYPLHDRIQVHGFRHRCPLITFEGRGNRVSDLYGEKLHEAQVGDALKTAGAGRYPFALLAPDAGEAPGRYVLFLAGAQPPVDAPAMALHLDQALCANIHYRHCRRLGQLRPPVVAWVDGGADLARSRYLDACVRRGQKMGAIKPTHLDHEAGWRPILGGVILDS